MRRLPIALYLLACAAAIGAGKNSQRSFDTPQAAARALEQAMEDNDTAALLKLFGPQGRSIVMSGDAAQDLASRTQFARLAEEKLQIREGPDRDIVVAGSGELPFPVPLVERNGRWRFDPALGRAEVLADRIGRNERDAIQVCREYVEAQMDYAAHHHTADGEPEYAPRIESASGKRDGLYSQDATSSPAPDSLAQAAAAMFGNGRKPAPYHGYWFRILTAQGPAADGGAKNYVVEGAMTGGFALVAYPAEYGVSGIRSFLVSRSALVYEKDLGPATSAIGRRMSSFDPDATWKAVVLQ